MADIIRDAPIGQLLRFISRNRLLQYPEEKADFKLPPQWAHLIDSSTLSLPSTSDPASPTRQDGSTGSGDVEEGQLHHSQSANTPSPAANTPSHDSNADSTPIVPAVTKDGAILVDWYSSNDSENPHNWSRGKRAAIAFIICIYTFVVYTSSTIYTSSTEGVMAAFGVTRLNASLGLSLYVLGYGIGPLVFSPLSEIPIIGRNPVYTVTMFLFVILSIPTAFATNFPGLVILRFLQGFFGSPCLAAGGASLGDIYSLMALPFAMTAWVAAAFCGPALGPLLSGFSVPAESWQWSLFETIWASAPVFLAMFVFLPETSGPNLLLRRARRLRKLTGDSRLVSQSEIDQQHMKLSSVLVDALIKPMEITIKDPAVLFVQVYVAIIYGIYYMFFEAFPLVYPVQYHMNLGQVGLVFLCILVACLLAVLAYCIYIYYYVNPRILKFGLGPNEERLIPALPLSVFPTIGLFLFAFTSRSDIHWIVPTIGITIYSGACFIILQCIFVYIPLSYPPYAASLFAANDFFRSAFASGAVLFSQPMFANLGIARGVSLLGGLSGIGIIGIWLLYFFGAKLRARSRFAVSG